MEIDIKTNETNKLLCEIKCYWQINEAVNKGRLEELRITYKLQSQDSNADEDKKEDDKNSLISKEGIRPHSDFMKVGLKDIRFHMPRVFEHYT